MLLLVPRFSCSNTARLLSLKFILTCFCGQLVEGLWCWWDFSHDLSVRRPAHGHGDIRDKLVSVLPLRGRCIWDWSILLNHLNFYLHAPAYSEWKHDLFPCIVGIYRNWEIVRIVYKDRDSSPTVDRDLFNVYITCIIHINGNEIYMWSIIGYIIEQMYI